MTSSIPAAHMGSILMMHFSSSTRWTVDSLHRFGQIVESFGLSSAVTMAALSKHLLN